MTQDKKSEIAYFDRLAPTYNKGSNPEIQWEILNALGVFKQCRNKYILEVGCGTGEFGRMLVQSGAFVIGVDISLGMVSEACSYNCNHYLVEHGDVEKEEIYTNDEFDAILCINFLHHFQDRFTVLHNFHKWLKPDGYLYIYEPNGSYPAHKFFTFCRDIIKNILPFVIRRLSSSPDIRFLKLEILECELLLTGFDYKCKLYDEDCRFPYEILSAIRYIIMRLINFFIKHGETNHFIIIAKKDKT